MKTITMMELRASPGEYAFRVRADGESFLVTYQGKPCFKMVPVDDVTAVRPDGTFKGPKPLTMGLKLGGEYAIETQMTAPDKIKEAQRLPLQHRETT